MQVAENKTIENETTENSLKKLTQNILRYITREEVYNYLANKNRAFKSKVDINETEINETEIN